MGGLRKSIFAIVGSLFFLLFHLGCIFFPPAAISHPPPSRGRRRRRRRRGRNASPLSSQPQRRPSAVSAPHEPRGSFSLSLRSILRHLVCCFFGPDSQQHKRRPHVAAIGPLPSTQQQLRHHLVFPEEASANPKAIASSRFPEKPDDLTRIASLKLSSFPSRDDVFPCTSCGEVFTRSHLLDFHQATRHTLSELTDGDSGLNIVRIIFQSGWKGRRGKESDRVDNSVVPVVHRVLKIHSSPRMLARFEEYRDSVRSRAAARWAAGCGGSADERCMADGNERLRFYCATFLCGLTQEGGNLGICGSPFCSACGIVQRGFAGKDADGVATHATGWGAHSHPSLPEELEREFESMKVRRAMLVCRVIAGRVALGGAGAAGDGEGGRGTYDSVVAAERGGGGWAAEDLLLVFDPRAVLPCFVIIYSV